MDIDSINSELDIIFMNIPENVPALYQLRWLYIKLGELFSYDYRIMKNPQIVRRKMDFTEDISKFQTCTQISEILAFMINQSSINCTATVIKRFLPNERYRKDNHVAVRVDNLDNGEVYLLDLTLDLYRIQSGMETKNFAYASTPEFDCNIIPLTECEIMDKYFGLTNIDGYLDTKIKAFKEKMASIKEYGFDEDVLLEYNLNYIMKEFYRPFNGNQEAKLYIENLLFILLEDNQLERMSVHNLSFGDDDNLDMANCYVFDFEDPKYYLFENKSGLVKSNADKIKNMLNTKWHTNSKTLENKLNQKNRN